MVGGNMGNKKLICRPCAESLKASGKVKIGLSQKDKATCEICNRRKYVYLCEMTEGVSDG